MNLAFLPGPVVQWIDASLGLFLEVLPFLALGALLAGILKATEDRLRLGSRLGSSPVSIVLGALLGCVLPVCSCGVVPVVLGLLKGGVPAGPVFAFLAAAPMVNPASFVMTAGVLGTEMAVGRLVGALLLGVLMGSLAERLLRRGIHVPPQGEGSCCACSGTASEGSAAASTPRGGRRVVLSFYHGAETFVSLFRFVGAGVLLGGLLQVFIDPASVAGAFRGTLSVPLAALAGVPLYLCSCAEVPVALSLLRKGLDPSAVLTFLLAGPGVSAFSLALLTSVLRPRAIALYASVFLAGSIVFGLAWRAWMG